MPKGEYIPQRAGEDPRIFSGTVQKGKRLKEWGGNTQKDLAKPFRGQTLPVPAALGVRKKNGGSLAKWGNATELENIAFNTLEDLLTFD